MKFLAHLTLLGSVAMSQLAWADAGPYYVAYPGYCNVKRVYVNAVNDVYGVEIGCSSILGQPLLGSFASNGVVFVARASGNGNVACMETYSPDGSLRGGCTGGGPIQYAPASSFSVRQSGSPEQSQRQYVISTEMPDLEKTKDLPALP